MLYDLDVELTFSWMPRVNECSDSRPKYLRHIPDSRKKDTDVLLRACKETVIWIICYVTSASGLIC